MKISDRQFELDCLRRNWMSEPGTAARIAYLETFTDDEWDHHLLLERDKRLQHGYSYGLA